MLQDIDQTARDTVTVREDPHLQGTICTTGEDAVTGSRLYLHDTGTDVAEDGLFSMFGAKRVHQPVAGQFPHLELEKAEKDRMARAVSFFSSFFTPTYSSYLLCYYAEPAAVIVKCTDYFVQNKFLFFVKRHPI